VRAPANQSASAALRVGCFLCCCLMLAAGSVSAQTAPTERTFHASKADVQKALHEVESSSGGKLPVLEGFAVGEGRTLGEYKRGYYQYEVQLKAINTTETTVHVDAKITAWYAGSTSANSGYRLLKSSGRLESDLLDALDDKLNPKSAATTSPKQRSAAAPLPDSPSTTASFFVTPRLTTAPSSAQPPATPAVTGKVAEPASGKRVQALKQEVANLEEALQNQTRPSDLAVVKRDNTPVVAQPLDGAEVLFQANAEDEFQVLDVTEGWVHVQISGLSRGWVKRDHVDLPGAATVSIATIRDPRDKDVVRQTKEEVGRFPGKWEPLDGKQVKIIWVQPLDSNQFGSEPKWNAVKSVLRKADTGPAAGGVEVAGVVVIFDSEDGGMAATTLTTLQQWRAGHLPDEAFWRRCWRDPVEAFKSQN
jgi:hypothetical protein